MQNEYQVHEFDYSENSRFYDYTKQNRYENEKYDKQIGITNIATRCIEDIERLITEVSYVIDLYHQNKNTHLEFEDSPDESLDNLFSEKFTPFLHSISNLECLFLCKLTKIDELMSKVKLFGNILQEVLEFDIQIEK
jgi:hypothetical protein